GMGTDHAEDQKKLVRLFRDWRIEAQKSILGRKFLLDPDDLSVLPDIFEAHHSNVVAAGGYAAWDALSVAEKKRRSEEVFHELCRRYGELKWADLSEEGRKKAECFVWAGCCMHKEMNSEKGGADAMKLFWEGIDSRPVKLMNKANAAAYVNGGLNSTAASHAEKVSEGGAIKLTSLLGALLNHKDDKKGQHDTFKYYFQEKYGYSINCPDTSNTRFQSHSDCAIFILTHLHPILEFMSHIAYSKTKIGLNHLESNVMKGLKDIPTLTELAVLALYANSVSYPYMRIVRSTSADQRLNALDLGPLHKKVIQFCERVSDNPSLLLSPNATHESGSLDGQLWHHPDTFYVVQQLSSSLPHLSGALKAYMLGAAETWKRFSNEFAEDGVIAQLSPHSRSKIFINPTNDAQEGRLGQLRKAKQHDSRLSLGKHNAKVKYAYNDTREFLRSAKVTDAFRCWLRREARNRLDSGREKKRRQELVEYEKKVVLEKKQKEDVKKAKLAARQAELDNLTPLLNIQYIQEHHKSIPGTEIMKNINWHRQFVEKNVIPSKSAIQKMPKDDKVIQLITAITRY
ncbi:hypothetical protein K435DRAFT_572870, partial [Dendrothele bispora CBS 962.96]